MTGMTTAPNIPDRNVTAPSVLEGDVFLGTILVWIFGLPPVERRRILITSRWVERGFFGSGMLQVDHDDLYIYYLIFKWSFIIAVGLASLYVTSLLSGLTFDFYFICIRLNQTHFVNSFLEAYVKQLSDIMLFVLVPFYAVMFRYHFNPRTHDLGSWNPRASDVRRLRPVTPLKSSIASAASIVFLGLIMYHSDMLYRDFMRAFHLGSSFGYLLISAFSIALTYSAFNRLVLMAVLVFWRFVGKRD